MTLQEFTISSSGGQRRLHVCQWTPEGTARAVVQLTHGMCEHILRYAPLAETLTARGFAVIGHDHLGHGHTALDRDDLGIFPADHPSQTLSDDIRKVAAVARARFPGLPVFLLGHSMGSFLARRVCMEAPKPYRGVILMATGDIPAPVVQSAKAALRSMIRLRGANHRPTRITALGIARNNRQFQPVETDNDWLSSDREKLGAYNADPLCRFTFSASGYLMLIKTIEYIQKPEHIRALAPDLSILFVSGALDPIGENGRGVRRVMKRYQKECGDVSLKLYPGCRHQILDETISDTICSDIADWVEARV